ncbi:hypothetical protein BDR05DRAFT_128218 [Suillus weaverae]|nr:hypothetical protein BDR05DRAFT_128218 [Suillus weaverae]
MTDITQPNPTFLSLLQSTLVLDLVIYRFRCSVSHTWLLLAHSLFFCTLHRMIFLQ